MFLPRQGWHPPDALPAVAQKQLSRFWEQALLDAARDACSRVATSRTDRGWPWSFTLEHDLLVLERACRVKSAKSGPLRDALFFVPPDSSDPLLELTKLLQARMIDFKKESSRTNHIYAMPIRLRLPSSQPPVDLTVQSTPVWLCTRPFLPQLLQTEFSAFAQKLPEKYSHPILGDLYIDCPTVAVVRGHGRDSRHAWQHCGDSWEIARGILELSWGAFSSHLSFGVDPEPPARLRSPRGAYLLGSSGQWEHSLFGYQFPVMPSRGQVLQLSDQARKNAEFLAHRVRACHDVNTVLGVWGRCMAIYNQAMEQPFAYAQWLHLWQCAERLAYPVDSDDSDAGSLSSRRGDTATVCRRLAVLFGGFAPEQPDVTVALGAVASLRNDIVHRGRHDHVEQEHVNFLKFVLDGSLIWVQNNSGCFPTTRHFEASMDRLVDSNANRLRSEVETIVESLLRKRTAGQGGPAD